MSKTHKNVNRLLAMVLSIAMVLTLTPVSAFGTDKVAAADAEVTVTVSNQGVLAKANDGSVMANKPVTVKDLDKDGILTYDEAIVAMHKAYNSESNYEIGSSGWVTKCWGNSMGNYLFLLNGVTFSTTVNLTEVRAGNKLYISINKDNTTYSDWYTFFDADSKNVCVNDEFTLNLKGRLGMGGTVDTALKDIKVGIWDNGVFKQIDNKVTDKAGNVTLSLNKAGTYYITALGTVNCDVIDWSVPPYDGKATKNVDAPIMAPVCRVDVSNVIDVTMTVNNQGVLAKAKDGTVMANRPVKVVDLDGDNIFTYDEALKATHKTYMTEADYNTSTSSYGLSVIKLWGVDTINTLFFTNGKGLATGVGTDKVKPGDQLYASVNKDDTNYADWYTSFDKNAELIKKNESITLNLKGKLGMGGTKDTPLAGIKVGLWDNGSFKQIDKKVTDKDGNVTLSFTAEGTYYVTAEGTVNCDIPDWSKPPFDGKATKNVDAPTMAPVCIVTVDNAAVDNQAVKDVEDLIDAIGAVDKNSGEAIKAARDAYMKLPADLRLLVSNINVLNKAEADYEKLTTPAKPAIDKKAEEMYKETGDAYYADPDFGYGAEWVIIGMKRGGYPIEDKVIDNYYKDVVKKLNETKGVLSERNYSEYSKLIIALTAAGYDATDVDGYNLVEKLADIKNVTKQGLNGPIWALIALDSGKYELPENATTSREVLIKMLLGAQLENGGWTYMGDIADVDMTAMTLQALAPYYGKNDKVTSAVDKALKWLSANQNIDGSFNEFNGNECAESTAQVIIALSALDINPDTDARFIKYGNSAIDGLKLFYLGNGKFAHLLNQKESGLATVQSFNALAAYLRQATDKNGLYDMSDAEKAPQTGDKSNIYFWIILLIGATFVIPAVRKKHHK